MSRPRGTARERLLAAVYELFQAKGIKAVAIDAIIARARSSPPMPGTRMPPARRRRRPSFCWRAAFRSV